MAEVYIDITTKYNYITQFAQIAQTLPGGIWIMKQACTELLQEYDRHRQVLKSEKLIFNGVTKQDVYNIAAPLLEGEEWIIPARVEPRSSENSRVMFFRQHEDKWMLATDLPQFNLQDPFWTHIHDELVFDVPKEELSEVISIVGHHMANAVELRVPLIVDFKQGYTWDEL